MKRNVPGSPITSGLFRNTVGPEASDSLGWDGSLTTGGVVPNGEYRLAVRALKIFAEDLNNEDSWETYITPVFIVDNSTNNGI